MPPPGPDPPRRRVLGGPLRRGSRPRRASARGRPRRAHPRRRETPAGAGKLDSRRGQDGGRSASGDAAARARRSALPDGARPARRRTPPRGRRDGRGRGAPLPRAGAVGLHPGPPRRRLDRHLPGVSSAALECPRADEGRDPLRPGSDPRRVRGPRDVDDLEMRAPPPSLRRREGRRPLSAQGLLRWRARAPDPALHAGAPADHRAPARHPRSRHGHRRADDGLDDGHILDADRARRARDRHWEAALGGRVGSPPGGDRDRRRHGGRPGAPASRLPARRLLLRRSGLREGRRRGGARTRAAQREGGCGLGHRGGRPPRGGPRPRGRRQVARRARRPRRVSRTASP